MIPIALFPFAEKKKKKEERKEKQNKPKISHGSQHQAFSTSIKIQIENTIAVLISVYFYEISCNILL